MDVIGNTRKKAGKKIVEHEKYDCIEQAFFIEDNGKWRKTGSIVDLEMLLLI